jgi:serine/threonine protein kinase/formylglycine-generating enzyme required for sulfatase activity/tetratricopeptide (TPR) repeat protein
MSERAIFLTALDKNDAQERSAYLDSACAGEPALRRRVEALLKSHDDAGSFLDAPIGEQISGAAGRTKVADPSPAAQGENLTETQAELPPAAESGLEFLTPSAKPSSLGRLDHYEVLELIGRGGMGVVLKAFDEVLHRIVAVKVLAPQLATNATARKRFVREAQAGAAVCHDHVVTIHAVDEGKAGPYLVMQCVAGLSLQDKLDQMGPLGLQAILRIGMQTAEGLAAAHKQGLVHRDIKPANILLENGIERVKITDFGLARAVDDASITQSGQVAGTPQYMSPEQAQGVSVDHRSDLFSLGSVLYAMCTGRPPFRATGSMAVLKRVCEDTPRPIREINPEIPDWLCDIIAKLHAKNPAERFQSATEVAELLRQHLAHLQQPTLVPAPAPVVRAVSDLHQSPDVSTLPSTSRSPLYRRALWFILCTWIGLGIVILPIWAEIDGAESSLLFRVVISWAAPLLLVSMYWTYGAIFFLVIRLLRQDSSKKLADDHVRPSTHTKWRYVLEASIFLALSAAALVWLDYNHPAWWKEIWNFSQPDQTSGSISIKWLDPFVVIEVVDEDGNTSRSYRSPFIVRLKPGLHRYRARKGETLLFDSEFRIAPGQNYEVDLSGRRWQPLLAKAPFSADEAKHHQEAWAEHIKVPVEMQNPIGMKFRLIPPGEFSMGTPDAERSKVLQLLSADWQKGLVREEQSSHRVSIESAFYLGVTELTVGQFRRFVSESHYITTAESNGLGGRAEANGIIEHRPEWTWKHPSVAQSDDHPVVQISLADARAFCRWLSGLDGREYYVPKEEEWEFACRAGTETQWYVENDPDLLDEAAWTLQNAGGTTHPVGKKTPNAFGLYDMLGNVEEVCVSDTGLPAARGGHTGQPLLCRCGSRVPIPLKETFYRRGVRIAAKTSFAPSPTTAPAAPDQSKGKPSGPKQSAEEQVKQVRAELKKLNAGFDGSAVSTSNYGVVTQFDLVTDQVTDISPVRALTQLKEMTIRGSAPGKSKLPDLSPLRGLPLKEIVCDFEPARDAFVLRSITTLTRINGKPTAEFWKAVDGQTIKAADCLVRAWEFAKADKWTDAEAEFRKAADAKPDDPQVFRWRGVIKAEAKHFDEAAADFDKALELQRWNARTSWSNHGGIDETVCQCDDVFGRVAKLRPIDYNLWVARARWFAQRGRWKEAADACAEILKRDPEDAEHWFMDAPLRLQLGDVHGYRQDCEEMVSRFAALHSPERGDQVAKTCSLLPDAVKDKLTVNQMADRALLGTEKKETYPWFMLCRALAHYRAEEYLHVYDKLGKVLSAQAPFAGIDATAHAVLAMTRWQSDQKDVARKELEQARDLIDKKVPKVDRGERFGNDWHDWLRCRILLREAETLIEGRPRSD